MNISPSEPGPLNFCKDGSESRWCKKAPAPGRASTSLTLFAASESTESNPDSSSDFSRSLSPQPNNMESAKKSVELTQDESEAFSRLVLPERQPGDRAGNLANGAIANLVDQVGAAVHVRGLPVNVSVDISISFMSKAKLGDEVEITSRVLGQLGRYCGTSILVRNKATGEVIAEVGNAANKMENAKKSVELTEDELEAFSRLVLPEPQTGECIYNHFAITGIRVDRVEPGFVACTLKVPPRLTDRAGNLANGAIANLVDLVGASVHFRGLPMNVSVDISISYLSKAKLGDELEITSKSLGQRGRYSGVSILMRNKATGEMIAEVALSWFPIQWIEGYRFGEREVKMEKAKKRLELNLDESETVSRVAIPALQIGKSSFYDAFALRGIRVERVEPGVVICSLFGTRTGRNGTGRDGTKDRDGTLANGAIANLVDIVGGSLAFIPDLPMNVSVDISVSYVSTAKVHDELEITSRVLGRTGGYCGTIVTFRNKSTGEIIAEGRHSLFRSNAGPVPKL
ncbi:unnamed protein product [Malus baccata var. baccata]